MKARLTIVSCLLAPSPRSMRQLHFLGAEPAKHAATSFPGRRAREAGGRIKPGAQAPGSSNKKGERARGAGGSAVARSAGSNVSDRFLLGLAPQALFCRPLRGLQRSFRPYSSCLNLRRAL
jgi:hypothetical protein